MAMSERVNASEALRETAPICTSASSRSFSAINSTQASLSADLSRKVGAIVLSLSREYLVSPVRALSTNSKSGSCMTQTTQTGTGWHGKGFPFQPGRGLSQRAHFHVLENGGATIVRSRCCTMCSLRSHEVNASSGEASAM